MTPPEDWSNRYVSFHVRYLVLGLLVCGCNHAALVGDPPSAPPRADLGFDAARSAEPDLATRPRERCNGLDDDGDGKLDEGCPIRLTTNPADDSAPSLEGRRVVWTRGTGVAGGKDDGVYLLDLLPDGAERKLASGQLWYPQLSGDRVAYLTYDGNPFRVITLSTGESVGVVVEAGGPQRCALGGDWLAWGAGVGTSFETHHWYDIFLHDLRTGQTTRLTDDAADQRYPRFSGRFVVWLDDHQRWSVSPWSSDDQFELTVYDLDSGERRAIPAGSAETGWMPGLPPAVGAGALLTTEYAGDSARCQAVTYDLATSARTALGPAGAPCPIPAAVTARWAVATTGSMDHVTLLLLDRRSGKKHALTTYQTSLGGAAVDGDLVVWSDARNGSLDLYRMDLSDYDDGDFFPEGIAP